MNWDENREAVKPSTVDMGRVWMKMMDEGSTALEIAAMQGSVTEKQITEAVHAWRHIPKEYRDKIFRNVPSNADGLITVEKAKAIVSQEKSYSLTKEEIKTLFEACRIKGGGVNASNMSELVKIVKRYGDPVANLDQIMIKFKRGEKASCKRASFPIKEKKSSEILLKYKGAGINFEKLLYLALKKTDQKMLQDIRSMLD